MNNPADSFTSQHLPSIHTPACLVQFYEEVAAIGAYQIDLINGEMHFSDGMFRLFGEEPGAIRPSLEWIDARSNPQDAAYIRQVLEQAISNKQPYSYARRIQRKDGQWLFVESQGKVITDAAGNAVKVIGIARNLTETKKAETERTTSRHNEERQTFLLKLSDALGPLTDPLLIQQTTLATLGEHIGFDRAFYSEIAPEVTTDTRQVNYVRIGLPSFSFPRYCSTFVSW